MLKLFVFFNLLFFAGDKSPKFHLKEDLAKDSRILTSEHGDYNTEVIKNAKAFNHYANQSFTGFKFKKSVKGKYTIFKWTKTTNPSLFVYEVLSVVPGATSYQEQMQGWDPVTQKNVVKPGNPVKLKTANFIFRTYIIKPATGNQLIYMTELGEGLRKYYIGKKAFYPIYESIALGMRLPNLQEILRLTGNVE